MFEGKSKLTHQSLLIPTSKLSHIKTFLPFVLDNDKYLQLVVKENGEQNTISVYGSECLIKIIRLTLEKPEDFLKIYAINFEKMFPVNKKNKMTHILIEYDMISWTELFHFVENYEENEENEENEKKQQKQQKQQKLKLQQLLQLILVFSEKIKALLFKYRQDLILLDYQCIDFYIKKWENDEYRVVIGLKMMKINMESAPDVYINSIDSLDKIVEQLMSRKGCNYNAFKKENQQNQIKIPKPLLKIKEQQQFLKLDSQEKQGDQKLVDQNLFYSSLVMRAFNKYAQNTSELINESIANISNLIYEKKLLNNINFNEQYITMIDQTTGELYKEDQIYMNLFCEHFEGLAFQVYNQKQVCPICSEKILFDHQKNRERSRNIFQMLLIKNFLNPMKRDVIYLFKYKTFILSKKQRHKNLKQKEQNQIQREFAHYSHYWHYHRTVKNLLDRNDVLIYIKRERISLLNRIWGKKKVFLKDELIQTPVRGKHCRHWQFYDLMKVYQAYLQTSEEYFQCFVCSQKVLFEQVIYLKEMNTLIDFAKQHFYSKFDKPLAIFLELDHEEETVKVTGDLGKGHMKQIVDLQIYQTLRDPLAKSRKRSENWNDKEASRQFNTFFFGH